MFPISLIMTACILFTMTYRTSTICLTHSSYSINICCINKQISFSQKTKHDPFPKIGFYLCAVPLSLVFPVWLEEILLNWNPIYKWECHLAENGIPLFDQLGFLASNSGYPWWQTTTEQNTQEHERKETHEGWELNDIRYSEVWRTV